MICIGKVCFWAHCLPSLPREDVGRVCWLTLGGATPPTSPRPHHVKASESRGQEVEAPWRQCSQPGLRPRGQLHIPRASEAQPFGSRRPWHLFLRSRGGPPGPRTFEREILRQGTADTPRRRSLCPSRSSDVREGEWCSLTEIAGRAAPNQGHREKEIRQNSNYCPTPDSVRVTGRGRDKGQRTRCSFPPLLSLQSSCGGYRGISTRKQGNRGCDL